MIIGALVIDLTTSVCYAEVAYCTFQNSPM